MTSSWRDSFLSLVFGLTGVGTALMGASLPAILHEGHLTDSRGGLLLLAAWGGSTSGAGLARGNLVRAGSIGLALSALGLSFMAGVRFPALPVLYFLYGLGLGLTMTVISTVRAAEVSPDSTDLELNRLNLLWAIGAFCAPALAARSLRLLSVNGLFHLLAAVFGVAAVACFGFSLLGTQTERPGGVEHEGPAAWAPLHLCLFAFAAVGLESALGGWLTTYVQRTTHGIVTAVSANSAFWAGLLLSRAAHSLPGLKGLRTTAARSAHVFATGLGTVLLLVHPTGALLPALGFLCGFGLGPLYPYVLSVALPRYRSTAVFMLAGVGASVIPWLTGVLSSGLGSLRLGLLIPAATVAMLMLVSARIHTQAKVSAAQIS